MTPKVYSSEGCADAMVADGYRTEEQAASDRAEIERLRDAIVRLRAAAKKALNYIANTESELDITLDSGDALRAVLESAP